jgi:hypothetical protein
MGLGAMSRNEEKTPVAPDATAQVIDPKAKAKPHGMNWLQLYSCVRGASMRYPIHLQWFTGLGGRLICLWNAISAHVWAQHLGN